MANIRGYEMLDGSFEQVDEETGEPTPEQKQWTKNRALCLSLMRHQPGDVCPGCGTDYDGLEAAP